MLYSSHCGPHGKCGVNRREKIRWTVERSVDESTRTLSETMKKKI